MRETILIDAFEKIIAQKLENGETDYRYAFNRNWHIATKALTEYASSAINPKRCKYEQLVEQFFGLPETVDEKTEIKADFGLLVNLLAWASSTKEGLRWVKAENELPKENGSYICRLISGQNSTLIYADGEFETSYPLKYFSWLDESSAPESGGEETGKKWVEIPVEKISDGKPFVAATLHYWGDVIVYLREIDVPSVSTSSNSIEELKLAAWSAWTSAANAFRTYPDNKHTFSDYWANIGEAEIKKLLFSSLSKEEGKDEGWKAKVEFYREQTDKLRTYINENNIGLPSQGFFDVLYEHVISKDQEIERLKQWKAEAMAVMPDFQEIGKILGVKLGEDVSSKIIPELKRYNQEIERLKLLLEKVWWAKLSGTHSTSQMQTNEELWQQFAKQNGLKGEC